MSVPAVECFAEIGKRLAELERERAPKCPLSEFRTLHECLHTPSRCPENCPLCDQWTGPQP